MAIVLSELIVGLLSIFFGIFVLIYPKLLSYLVALYLIVVGLMAVLSSTGIASLGVLV